MAAGAGGVVINRWEVLEQRVRDEAAETRVLINELAESRKEEDQLELTRREAESRAELLTLRQAAELEVLRTALTAADSRLIDARARLQLTEQNRDKLRSEVVCSETELLTTRDTLAHAEEQLQGLEQEQGQFSADMAKLQESQEHLEVFAARSAESQAQLAAEVASAARMQGTGTPSVWEELKELRQLLADSEASLEQAEQSQEELRQEAKSQHAAKLQLESEVVTVMATGAENREELEAEMHAAVANAEIIVHSRTEEVEQLLNEMAELNRAEEEVAMLQDDLEVERKQFQKARRDSKKHEEELRTTATRAMAEAESLHRLVSVSDKSREQARRRAALLTSELASVTAEHEEFQCELERERARVQEERTRAVTLHFENQELREGAERQRQLSHQELEMVRGRVQKADAILEEKCQAEAIATKRLEEQCAHLHRKMHKLREDRGIRFGDTHAEKVDLALYTTLTLKDRQLLEEKRQEEHYSKEALSEHEECRALRKLLARDQRRLQDEMECRMCLEKVVEELSYDKEDLSSKFAVAIAEIGAFHDQEGRLNSETAMLRRSLVSEQEELQEEQQRQRRLKEEVKEIQDSKVKLEAQLEVELCRADAERSGGYDSTLCDGGPRCGPYGGGCWPGKRSPDSWPWGDKSVTGKRHIQALRDELATEREQLAAGGSQHAVLLEAVCKIADTQKAARAKAMVFNDNLRRQLCAETKYVAQEAEELRIAKAMDEKAGVQSEQLREAEVRREQLEAETSLMAMEVATLSKDLGGRLLEDGALGLSRRPFTIHDILREAWRNGHQSDSLYGGGMHDDQRQRGKAARDAYFVNLYLKWLRRGPYRHRVHITGVSCFHP